MNRTGRVRRLKGVGPVSRSSRFVGAAIGVLVATALTLGPASSASAQCRAVWVPSADGGELDLLCDGYTGPGGGSGGGGGAKPQAKKKKPKPKPQFGAIAQNPIPVGNTYKGVTTAGYRTKGKARKRALRGCRRESGGDCDLMATVKNGWAVLVAAGDPFGTPHFFSGTAKSRFAARSAAEARAEEALGAALTGEIQLVVGVNSRVRKKKR
jgi:hypothetical protein